VHHLSFSLVGWRPSGQDAEPLKSAHKASSTACVCGSGVGGGVGGGVLVVYVCERWPIPAPRPVPSSSFQLPAFIWSSDCDIVATITSGSDAHQRTNMEASIFALCTANAPLKLRTNWAYRMVIPILFYAPTRPRCLGGPSPPKIV